MDRISIMIVDDHAFIRMGIVALIGTCEDMVAVAQASNGAGGYLVKGMLSDMLATAIRQVQAGRRFLPSPVLRALQSRTPNAELTIREREVLALLAKGITNREIAIRLAISEVTVKCHVGVILMRLNATNRT
jgi:DNA-binding NarL/FixJ family response regulator